MWEMLLVFLICSKQELSQCDREPFCNVDSQQMGVYESHMYRPQSVCYSIKSTGIKLLICWKSTKKSFISHNSCLIEMWKLTNSLISSKEKSSCPPEKLFDPIKSNYTSNPEVISKIFNTYFVSIGQQLPNKIPPPVHHTYPVKVSGPKNSFVFHDTFVEVVNMVINNLLVSKSNRQNDIPTHILKLSKNALSPFLVQIFNLCIREGTIPKA